MFIGASEVAQLGVALSFLAAAWAVVGFARRIPGYGPLLALTAGAVCLIGGNAYDDGSFSTIESAALVALALGFAVASYTVTRRRRLRGAVRER